MNLCQREGRPPGLCCRLQSTFLLMAWMGSQNTLIKFAERVSGYAGWQDQDLERSQQTEVMSQILQDGI